MPLVRELTRDERRERERCPLCDDGRLAKAMIRPTAQRVCWRHAYEWLHAQLREQKRRGIDEVGRI